MAFGTFGIAAPAQMMAANAIPELSLANTKAATAAAKPAALPGDRIIRGDAATNPNAYREAIAKFSGNPDAKASRPATTLEATPRAVATPHSPATPYTEATSVLAPPPPLNGADPWGVAAGEAGATLGAVLGGSAGGAGAGAAGTLVAPGVGTIAGAAVGAADGAIAGAIVGAGIGYAIGTTAHDLATKMTGSAEPPSKGSAGLRKSQVAQLRSRNFPVRRRSGLAEGPMRSHRDGGCRTTAFGNFASAPMKRRIFKMFMRTSRRTTGQHRTAAI